jgi:hypothetical protein
MEPLEQRSAVAPGEGGDTSPNRPGQLVAPGEIATDMTGHEDVDPKTVERPGNHWAVLVILAKWPS